MQYLSKLFYIHGVEHLLNTDTVGSPKCVMVREVTGVLVLRDEYTYSYIDILTRDRPD